MDGNGVSAMVAAMSLLPLANAAGLQHADAMGNVQDDYDDGANEEEADFEEPHHPTAEEEAAAASADADADSDEADDSGEISYTPPATVSTALDDAEHAAFERPTAEEVDAAAATAAASDSAVDQAVDCTGGTLHPPPCTDPPTRLHIAAATGTDSDDEHAETAAALLTTRDAESIVHASTQPASTHHHHAPQHAAASHARDQPLAATVSVFQPEPSNAVDPELPDTSRPHPTPNDDHPASADPTHDRSTFDETVVDGALDFGRGWYRTVIAERLTPLQHAAAARRPAAVRELVRGVWRGVV